ncbi:uncharacterized protein FYW23_002756 [Sylvia borin]
MAGKMQGPPAEPKELRRTERRAVPGRPRAGVGRHRRCLGGPFEGHVGGCCPGGTRWRCGRSWSTRCRCWSRAAARERLEPGVGWRRERPHILPCGECRPGHPPRARRVRGGSAARGWTQPRGSRGFPGKAPRRAPEKDAECWRAPGSPRSIYSGGSVQAAYGVREEGFLTRTRSEPDKGNGLRMKGGRFRRSRSPLLLCSQKDPWQHLQVHLKVDSETLSFPGAVEVWLLARKKLDNDLPVPWPCG